MKPAPPIRSTRALLNLLVTVLNGMSIMEPLPRLW
jgi:hypothetical protein